MTTIFASAWETLDNDGRPLGDNLAIFRSLADANAHAVAEVDAFSTTCDGHEVSREVRTFPGTNCVRVAATFTWGTVVSHVHPHEVR